MARRGSGEGSFHKRKNGTWAAQLVTPMGKRVSVYAPTYKECREKLGQLRREVEAGLHDSAQAAQSFGGYARAYIDIKAHSLRSKSVSNYEYYMTHCQDIAALHLNKITPARLKLLYASKLAAGYAPTTVHHLHDFVHVVLEDAVEAGILPANPADRVKPPPVKTEPIQPLTWDQAQAVVAGVRGMRNEVGYLLAMACGMRSAEIRGVRWQDVNLELHRIKVLTTLKRVRGRYVLEETKSHSSRRTLPLPVYVVESLRAHKRRQDEDKRYMGAAWQNPWDLVLATGSGEPVGEGPFLRSFQRRCKRLGLSGATTIHDLRHTFATLMLERGVHIMVVSKLLGHTSVDLTLRVYGHITPRMEAGAITEMNALLPEIAGYGFTE